MLPSLFVDDGNAFYGTAVYQYFWGPGMFEDDITAVFRFVVILFFIALILAIAVFIAKNVATPIFLVADRSLAAKMFGGLGLIMFAGVVLAIAQIIAAFMHLRKR